MRASRAGRAASGPASVPSRRARRRRLIYLLDLLCEHEESVIESHTIGGTVIGELDRKDARSARVVMRRRRVWRSAQEALWQLQEEESV